MRLEGLYSPLRKMLIELLSSHGVTESELSLTFVGRDRIRRLNRQYLGRDRVTDVIAFDLSGDQGKAGDRPLVGDIYVCVARAASQAKERDLSLEEELFRLAAHGALHLLGYDHERPGQARRMTQLQEKVIKNYFPTI